MRGREYFLSYQDYPFFRDKTVGEIHDVNLLHGSHLYWPEADIDLENPERYPFEFKDSR